MRPKEAQRYNRVMAYRDRSLLTLAVLAPLLAAGCGGSSKSGPATFDELYGDFATTICNLEVRCGDMPDMATCLASLQLDTTDYLTIKADIASGKIQYDAAKGRVCAAWYERYGAAACTLTGISAVAADTNGSDACASAITGNVPDGGACFSLNECVSRKCAQSDPACLPSVQCCAGTCVPKPASIPVGANCEASLPDQICEGDAVCITTASSTTATCIAPSKVRGTPCTTQYECATPLFCQISGATLTGTCQPAVATGQLCSTLGGFRACENLRDYCSQSASRCTPRGAVGAACTEEDVNSCLGYAQCIGSTCVALSPARGACNPTDGPGCLGNLQCSAATNTCEFPAAASACM